MAKKRNASGNMTAETQDPLILAPLICVPANLRMAARASTRLYDKALAPLGLNITQYSILSVIARVDEVPTMTLAGRLSLERTALYRALAILERRGLIKTRAGRGREQLLSLTDSGIELREAALPVWQHVQDAFVEAFGDEWPAFLDQIRHACEVAENSID